MALHDNDIAIVKALIGAALLEERRKMKAYVDAKVADAIRQQAWLKLSYSWQDGHEELEAAKKELQCP